jgi:hypothetical protein
MGLGRSNTVIMVLSPTGGMDVCLRFSVLCCPVLVETLHQADHPSKESNQMHERFHNFRNISQLKQAIRLNP